MESFNTREYRDNLAKDLKEIHKTDSEKAQKVLEEEEKTIRFKEAEGVHEIHRTVVQSEFKERKEKLKKEEVLTKMEEGNKRANQIFSIQKKIYEQDDIEVLPNEIATSLDEISNSTKVYVGELVNSIFKKLPASIEYIYASFPNQKIKIETFNVGEVLPIDLKDEIRAKKVDVSSTIQNMLNGRYNRRFTPIDQQNLSFVTISAGDLDHEFNDKISYEDIIKKARNLGLKELPDVVGLEYAARHFDFHQPVVRRDEVIIATNLFFDEKFDEAEHKYELMTLTIDDSRKHSSSGVMSWAHRDTGLEIMYSGSYQDTMTIHKSEKLLFCFDPIERLTE